MDQDGSVFYRDLPSLPNYESYVRKRIAVNLNKKLSELDQKMRQYESSDSDDTKYHSSGEEDQFLAAMKPSASQSISEIPAAETKLHNKRLHPVKAVPVRQVMYNNRLSSQRPSTLNRQSTFAPARFY